MFTNIFRKDNQSNRPITLFEDYYLVAEIEPTNLSKNRQLIQKHNQVLQLYSSRTHENLKKYFEIVYQVQRKTFMIYHHEDEENATNVFDQLKSIMVPLVGSLQLHRSLEDALETIMASFRKHPHWTATHMAASLGLEAYFNENIELAQAELNIQYLPDMMTPLHLAVKNRHHLLVEKIAELYQLNLDLVDARQYSLLHLAAVSTSEVLRSILVLPGMFERMLWKDLKGSTPLHLACFAENFDNICEFLKFGLTTEMLTLPTPKLTYVNGKPNHRPKVKADSKVIKLEDIDFYDLDLSPSKNGAPSDISSVGGILHWVKHHRLMGKLLQYNFDVNCTNLNGDTPLHVMVKRGRFICVLNLLCNQARVETKNLFGKFAQTIVVLQYDDNNSNFVGNTALHHAIQGGSRTIVQTLIVFEANINAQNNKRISVRHEAATCPKAKEENLLYVLSSLGARRCPADMVGCNEGCKHDGQLEGYFNVKLFEVDPDRDKFFSCPNIEKIIKETLAMDNLPSVKGHRVNMLCFDGGGVKGLISLQILIEVERYLKHSISKYFRWMSGTSTGSILAASLANGRSLRHIRDLYFIFKNKLFSGQRPYSSELFESILKDEFGPETFLSDLRVKYGKHMIIPAVLFDRNPIQLHLFRSYPSPQTILSTATKSQNAIVNCSAVDASKSKIQNSPKSKQKFPKRTSTENFTKFFVPPADEFIWRACRASGAAPTYFNAYGNFVDGGLIANNPTLDAITELQNYNAALAKVGRGAEHNHLVLVLSLGCGRFQRKKVDMIDVTSMYSFKPSEMKQNLNFMFTFFNLLLNEVCNTNDHIVDRCEAACSQADKVFFRINPFVSQEIELDEKYEFKIISILWETKRYMYLMRDQVQLLANFLEKTTDLVYATGGEDDKDVRKQPTCS